MATAITTVTLTRSGGITKRSTHGTKSRGCFVSLVACQIETLGASKRNLFHRRALAAGNVPGHMFV
jgi:hypothetical protein